MCVQNCGDFAYNYVNNDNTMQCEYCGEGCHLCSPQRGCLSNFKVDRGSRFLEPQLYPVGDGLYSPEKPSDTFVTPRKCADPRCDKCQKYDSVLGVTVLGLPVCDSCYQYVNFYPLEKQSVLNCALCENSVVDNCATCDPDRQDECASCNQGFYLEKTTTISQGIITVTTQCLACPVQDSACSRCDQSGCLQCSTGYALNSDNKCVQCDIDVMNKDYFFTPQRCTQCQPTNPSQCRVCDIGYQNSKSAPADCALKCDFGQYPSVQFSLINYNENTITATTCLDCDASCDACVGAGTNQCLSCKSDLQFLSINDIDAQTGTCVSKSVSSTQSLDIFVLPSVPDYDTEEAIRRTDIGSFQNPFWDIQFAVERAQELAVQYTNEITANIYLMKGDHFVIRDKGTTNLVYRPTLAKPNKNLNYHLTLQPLPCTYASAQKYDISSVCTSQPVTIYNKNREQFQIFSPLSLTVTNVQIDSIDSVLFSLDPALIQGCLSKRETCCQITNGQIKTVDGSTMCESALEAYLQSEESNCLVNEPRAMFPMHLNQQQHVKTPNRVKLDSVTITNMFYAVNAIITTAPIWGIIEIKNSRFTQLNMCGSVVKTFFEQIGKPKVQERVTGEYLSVRQRELVELATSQVEFYQNPGAQTCSLELCHSVTIEGTTFNRLPFLTKPFTSFKLVAEENGMQSQGLIISTKSNKGQITIQNNLFTNNLIPVRSCQPHQPQTTQLDNYSQLFNPQSDFSLVQLTSLISIEDHRTGAISISSNTFTENVMVAGLIRIQSVGEVGISGNTFGKNAALVQSNVLQVRSCSKVTIAANTFTSNCGCSTTGLMLVQCPSAQFRYDKQLDFYHLIDGSTPQTGSSANLQQNTFTSNFAGKDKHIVSIEGFEKVQISGDTYSQNENYLPQSFNRVSAMSRFFTEGQRVSTLDAYQIKAQAIVRVAATKEVNIISTKFSKNWVSDHQSYQDDYQSNAILVQDLAGVFLLDNVQFLENQGVSNSQYAQIQGLGYRSSLLVLKNVDIQTLTFQQITFQKNTLFYSRNPKVDAEVIMPSLFQFTHAQISQSNQIVLKDLVIDDNDSRSGDFLVYLQLKKFSVNPATISANNATSIIVIDLPTDSSSDTIILKNVVASTNRVWQGAIFKIRESSDLQFSQGDIKPTNTEPTSPKLTIDSSLFSLNRDVSDQAKTSCILVEKSVQRTYPWLDMRIYGTKFQQNTGRLSSAIWVADSMLRWLVIDKVTFTVSTTTPQPGRLAQFLYKNDQYGYLKVQNSEFECNLEYDKSVTMVYNLQGGEGRPSLFRITNPQKPARLSQLQISTTAKNNGTLSSSLFRNQFFTNTYTGCNQHDRGAIFYLESGAKVYEYGSDYYKVSALEGGLAYLDGDATYLTIDAAVRIKNLYAYYGAVIYATNGATAHILNDAIINFSEAFEGTVAYLTQRSRLLMTKDIKLQSLVANKGGMIYSSNGCQFLLDGVQFINCKCGYQASIINIENGRELYHLVNSGQTPAYGVSYYQRSFMHNCQITRSAVEERGRLISVSEAALQVNQTQIYANENINVDNYGIEVFSGELSVINSSFTGTTQSALFSNIYQKDLQEVNGAFIAVYGDSKLEITDTQFARGRSTNGGCIALFGSIDTTIQNSGFTRCAAMMGGAIYSSAFKKLIIRNSTFQDNIGYQGYGQNIYAVGGTGEFQLDNCTLKSRQNSVQVSSRTININECLFEGAVSSLSSLGLSNGGGLNIPWALEVTITGSQFRNLKAKNGGAIYYHQQSDNTIVALDARYRAQSYSFTIKQTEFVNNDAELRGGTLYLHDIKAGDIKSSNFLNSKAEQGGAIYFWCEPSTLAQQKVKNVDCALELGQLGFDNCTAKVGGALFWNFIEPYIMPKEGFNNLAQLDDSTFTYQSLVFKRCRAEQYGPQIAGVARELVQVSNQTFRQYYDQSGPRRQEVLPFSARLNVTRRKPLLDNYVYGGVQSGGNVPASWFLLLDKYGQVVQTNSGGQIKFNLDMPKFRAGSVFTTDILGMMDFYSMFGTFETANMGILSAPDINMTVSITVNAIDINVPSTQQYLAQHLNKPITSTSQYRIDIIMRVRPCILGEGLKETGACFTCPAGAYLLTVPTQAMECAVCQIEKSICLGGSDIGPKPGFWRKSKETYQFIPCKQSSACLGKDVTLDKDEPGNAVGLCNLEQGYYGVLCTACLPGFKRQDIFECSKCAQIEPYFIAGAFVIIIFGLCYLINSTIKGAAAANNTHSVFNKILMNHMQMLLITASFDMNWPEDVKTIFNLAAPIAQITSSITSFDCYMDTKDASTIDPYNFYVDPYDVRIVYQKLFIMAALPIVMAIASYSIWYVILRWQRALAELHTKFVASVVLLLFLVHPSITQSMIDMFNCQDLDGDLRLVVDMQVICYEGLHFYMAWCLALPCLLLWGCGIPLIVLVMMRKDSDNLDTTAVKQKFGFLYNGYKRHNYFWEIVIMYRKILCIFIAVFLNRVGIIVQALVLLILLVVFLQANAQNRPFAERALNDIEALSLATQIITIYCGIFFISAKDPNSGNFDKNRDLQLSSEGKLIFFGVIAFCNLAFMLLWLVKFIVVVKVLIKDKYPKLYIVLFLCGRADKMAFETAKRARDRKKEAIIQSIESVTLMMSKMKSMYINNVAYEDHNRFLKLLYFIESERNQIDLQEKRHDYYIQGPISRHRRFDPEIVKEAQDKRPIEVEPDFLDHERMSKFDHAKRRLNSIIHLQPTPLKKQKSQYSQSQLLDQSTIKDNSDFIQLKHGDSGVGPDLLDDVDLQEPVISKKETKQPQKKKRQKKQNQADLQALYLNSRNAAVALKSERNTHIRAKDVSKVDGSVKEPELPDFLRGFDIGQEMQNEQKQDSQFQSIDSIQENLYLMRKLSDRFAKVDSPIKQSSTKKFKQQNTGISQSQGPGESEGKTGIDVSQSHLSRADSKLQPFIENDETVELRDKLGVREITVTRDGGQTAPLQEVVEAAPAQRKRPKNSLRHELIGNQVIAIDHGIEQSVEDELKITIMDENDNFVAKTRLSLKQKQKTRQSITPQQLPQIISKQEGKGQELLPDERLMTESFHTDPSMQDYDQIREESPVRASEDVPFKPMKPTVTNGGKNEQSDRFLDRKQARSAKTIQEDVLVGEGLIKQQDGPNFHPNVSPGIIFDSSESRKSDDESQEDGAQESKRSLLPENFEIGGLDAEEKSRNLL